MTTVDTIIRRALLIDRQLTIGQLALKLHRSRVALSRVLNGQAALSIDLALELEAKYALNARDLLIIQLDNDIEATREQHAIRRHSRG